MNTIYHSMFMDLKKGDTVIWNGTGEYVMCNSKPKYCEDIDTLIIQVVSESGQEWIAECGDISFPQSSKDMILLHGVSKIDSQSIQLIVINDFYNFEGYFELPDELRSVYKDEIKYNAEEEDKDDKTSGCNAVTCFYNPTQDFIKYTLEFKYTQVDITDDIQGYYLNRLVKTAYHNAVK